MDSGEKNDRTSYGASRPPRQTFTEDTPLFTDVTYTPPRRTPNNGRPESSGTGRRSASGAAGRTPANTGRGETPARNREQTGQRPCRDSRTAPVYTELSWSDINRSTDFSSLGRPARPETPPKAPPAQPRGGSAYFGGFEQEMQQLFYNDPPTAERQAAGAAPVYTELPYGSSPDQTAARSGASAPTGYPPQESAQRQYTQRTASRQTTPFQSIRQTAYRQATRSQLRQNTGRAPAGQRTSVRSPGNTPPPANGGNHASYTPRGRKRGTHPVFYIAGLVVMALVIFLLARLAGSGVNKPTASTRPVSTAVAVTQTPGNTLTAGETPEPTPAATATPTPAPTPTPAGPKARQLGELIVPADWGPSVPERKRAVYDSFFDRSIMIGNSMVEGFKMWSDVTNIRYVPGTGATVVNAIGTLDLSPLTLNAPDYYNQVYLMFGLNEIGTDVNSFVQNYKRLVDFVREYEPHAVIYIISVTPVTRQVDEDPNEVQKMDRIRLFNAALQEFCKDQNCWYLDIYNMMLDENGYLSGEYAFVGDGKHFEKSGYVAWANYMKLHYVDEGLLTE